MRVLTKGNHLNEAFGLPFPISLSCLHLNQVSSPLFWKQKEATDDLTQEKFEYNSWVKRQILLGFFYINAQ